MDFLKLTEFKNHSIVQAFLQDFDEIKFKENLGVFLKDPGFREYFGFSEKKVEEAEFKLIVDFLKNPQRNVVLKYNVLLCYNTFLSTILRCHVDVLDFSNTRSGTHKYIKALTVLRLPIVRTARRLMMISAGNYANALIKAMNRLNIEKELVIIIDNSVGWLARRKLQRKNVRLIRTNLKLEIKEPLELLFSPADWKKIESEPEKLQHLRRENLNVTDFYEILKLETGTRYGRIVLYSDIVKYFGKYDYVVCPFGSGELFYGLLKIFERAYLEKRRQMPYFIGVIPFVGNPSRRGGALDFGEIRDTIAKALSTPVHKMEQKFREFYKRYRGVFTILPAVDLEFNKANEIAKRAGINSEITGSSALVFLLEDVRPVRIKPTDRVLMVNTGNGHIL